LKNRQAEVIDDVFEISASSTSDQRGQFRNFYRIGAEDTYLGGFKVRQINLSATNQSGTVRGMHLQIGKAAERKIVYCIRGEIFDVVVDLRPESRTFGHWFSRVLNPAIGIGLAIPPGCAHGYQTMVDDCEVLYLHDNDYDKSLESGVNALDEELCIDWPLSILNLSMRDRNLKSLANFRKEIGYEGKQHEL